jgi:uracil DNA glycosylase
MSELKKLLHSDWFALLDEKIKVNFVAVCQKTDLLYEQNPGHIFPPKNQVFAAFNLMAVTDIKVVILGQDPYPTVGYANGFCFSVNPDNKIPKSLKLSILLSRRSNASSSSSESSSSSSGFLERSFREYRAYLM